MGSEQSNAAAGGNTTAGNNSNSPRFNQRPASADAARLQRGYTIAVPPTADNLNNSQLSDTSPPPILDSRPTSPPMSVCSDSDLPYISYTNKPIGGNLNYYFYCNLFLIVTLLH
jgi:hypothetical protein